MKKFKLFAFATFVITLTFTMSAPCLSVVQATVLQEEKTVEPNHITSLSLGQLELQEQRDVKLAEKLTNYFQVDDNNVVLNVDKDTLINELGMSEEEATEILNLSQIYASENIIVPNRQRGFVGLHLDFGPKLRSLGAWAAGLYVGARVGWYLKQFATTPHTAGVVAIISGSIVWVVKEAIRTGLRRQSIGVNIPGWSWSFRVSFP
ncbi:MAG: hypothetical protein LBV67_02865 [Streptococcaceae bacterium]|jgi:hypothetical protein|nr:hypothetical protein [Streptococcaceae bacterium]